MNLVFVFLPSPSPLRQGPEEKDVTALSRSVTAWAGLALVSRAGSRRKGESNITRPRDEETTNRFYENDGLSTRVHELAFGIVICFVMQFLLVCECPLIPRPAAKRDTGRAVRV